MSWADPHIETLQRGQTVSFRPRGHSMHPRVRSGQRVTVAPLAPDEDVVPRQVVLCRVRGRAYLHLVKATRTQAGRREYMIGNARGRVNGWTPREQIFGVLVGVEP